jgi:hypothetical protein
MADDCFKNCDAFKTLHINTVYTLINDWFSGTQAKFDRLLWAKDKKKLIIVGGSGSYWGYDCSIIDAALGGEYEIVNLGENAQVTALMYFDIIEDFITEGDIVLWVPEPGIYTLGASTCHSRFWDFRKADYGYLQYLNFDYYDNLFSSFSRSCMMLPSKKFKNFDRLSPDISKYGDELSPKKTPGTKYPEYNFTSYSLTAEDSLSELFTNITDKGGKIFFSFAAMQEHGFDLTNKSDIIQYEEMVTSLPGIVSISKYEDCVFIDELFHDSCWHLSDDGMRVRAAFVAQDILRALGKID